MPLMRCTAILFGCFSVLGLVACGGGGSAASPAGSTPAPLPAPPGTQPPPSESVPPPPDSRLPSLAAPEVTLSYGIKQLRFSWADVVNATHYKMFERIDSTAEFIQIGSDFRTTSVSHDIALHRRGNAAYRIDACNRDRCISSTSVSVGEYRFPNLGALVPAIGYVKASNTKIVPGVNGQSFGSAVALSADARTLAVGSPFERSTATGINGDQNDDTGFENGSVYGL